MLGAFSQKLAQSGQTAGVIISVALMLFLGFAMTRITKALRLPDVTAYILTGILIGPKTKVYPVPGKKILDVIHFRHGFYFRYRAGVHCVQCRRVF